MLKRDYPFLVAPDQFKNFLQKFAVFANLLPAGLEIIIFHLLQVSFQFRPSILEHILQDGFW